jgi:hypothetical protein
MKTPPIFYAWVFTMSLFVSCQKAETNPTGLPDAYFHGYENAMHELAVNYCNSTIENVEPTLLKIRALNLDGLTHDPNPEGENYWITVMYADARLGMYYKIKDKGGLSKEHFDEAILYWKKYGPDETTGKTPSELQGELIHAVLQLDKGCFHWPEVNK